MRLYKYDLYCSRYRYTTFWCDGSLPSFKILDSRCTLHFLLVPWQTRIFGSLYEYHTCNSRVPSMMHLRQYRGYVNSSFHLTCVAVSPHEFLMVRLSVSAC
jgi:hypothetical protein